MTVDDLPHRGPPSGDQYVITRGSSEAQITQVGATLRAYSVDGQDVIDGFGPEERAADGRGQVLAPWPNRLTDGRYRYGNHDCQAALNEPGRHDAIHGLVRWSDWSPVAHHPGSVAMACAVRPQPGYAWQLDLAVTYALDAAGLTVTTRAVNTDVERAPFGVGFHPYLTVGATSIDGLDLCVPAARYLDPSSPAERPVMVPVAMTPWDFTQSRRIGTTQLDTAFGELTRGDDRRAVARLSDPVAGRSLELWVDEGYRYLMVYTADQVGQHERRRTAVAVEPMTCPPDALRSGVDLIELDPDETWTGRWGLRPAASPTGLTAGAA
jgi:aldose 1-epimerase